MTTDTGKVRNRIRNRIPCSAANGGEINDGIETDLETFSQEAGERDGDFLEQIKTENRSRYDYREFLRKICSFS